MKLGYVAFWVAISLLLFGCDQRPDNGVRICVNSKTHERVSASECGSDSNNAVLNGLMWYWILSNNTNYNVPRIGSSVEGYNYRPWSSQDEAISPTTRNNETVEDNLSGEVTTDAPASTGGEGAASESSEPSASEDSGASSGGSGEAPEASSPSEESSGSSGGGESEDSGASSGGGSGGEE